MINLHDKIIVDMIKQAEKADRIRSIKAILLLTLFFISFMDGVIIYSILLWSNVLLSKIGYTNVKLLYFVPINIFPGTYVDDRISGVITMLVPFLISNYFFIFYKKRYIKILERYEYKKGYYILFYYIFGSLIFLVPIGLAIFVFN